MRERERCRNILRGRHKLKKLEKQEQAEVNMMKYIYIYITPANRNRDKYKQDDRYKCEQKK